MTTAPGPDALSAAKRALLEKRLRGAARAPAPAAQRPRRDKAPLSFAQERLWFLHQWEPESTAYNVVDAFRVRGALDVDALRKALDAVVARHDVLRTRIAVEDDVPHQVVAPPGPCAFAYLDATGHADPLAEAARVAREENETPFDLATGPVHRFRLVRVAPDDHVLVLAFHHVAFDGWSIGVFFGELAAAYAALRRGEAPAFPPLPMQYADYAAWQRETQAATLEAHVEHWTRRLRGIEPLDLPTDRPRPAVPKHEGARYTFLVPKAVAEGVAALAREEGATDFMALLAAFQSLLHRHTGQQDVAVGTPVAGRSHPDTAGLVGFFVNTLVLRGDLAGEPTFREMVRRARDLTLEAFAHQDAPFERLVEALQPERDASRTPLFQVMFAVHSVGGDVRLADLDVRSFHVDRTRSKFDLSFFLQRDAKGLWGMFAYDVALFDEATIARLSEGFLTLLAAAVEAPDRRVADLPVLTPELRTRIVHEWNATQRDAPLDRTVPQLFEAAAARSPDAPAVAFQGETLTYRELDAQANRIARRLRALGVKPGVLVALCAQRSPAMLAGMLGVMKAGGAYVPIEPSNPEARIRLVMEDAGAAVLLTDAATRGRIPTHPVTLLLDDPALDAEDASDLPHLAGPDDLAYVIYTSGSTGKPKGVMVRHEGLTNYSWWCANSPLLEGGNGTLVHSSLAFDLALTGVYPPLVCGKRVALLPEDAGPAGLADALRAERDLSFVKLTPSHLKLLLQDLPPEDLAGRVRAFVVGGEQLTPDDVRPILERAPGVRILNHYGPTETVIGCCTHWVTPEDARGHAIPIGRPIHNTQLHVLDAHMQPVPPGVVGELYVGGAGVARGYLHRPDLTAERFVPDPFSPTPGARLYRTGDRVRRRPDGEIEFLGRADHQVKIRGHRVEPGEVEAALREQPGVRDALVVAKQDEAGAHLVAYVVHDGAPPQQDALAAALATRLPEPMVPSAFVVLDRFPLNANGKVDRKALPEPGRKVRQAARSRPPRTTTEELVLAVWEHLLGTSGIGAEDDFFHVGGHSLLATRVVNRIQAALGVKVTLKDFFARPTVAALAALVDARVASHPATPPLVAQGATEAPLSYSQRRLWFLHKWDPENTAYHVPWALRLRGALDVDALHRALDGIVRRHAILRTTYEEMDGEPRQRVHDPAPLPLPVLDVADEREAARVCAAEARRPFDLAKGPVLRATLLRLDAQDHVLLLVVHHVAFDGWSASLFGRELEALYRGAELPDLPLQYADYAAWQRAWLTDEAVASDLAHVRRRLDGVPVLDLPTDHARPAVQAGRGRREGFALPPDLSDALRRFAREQDATPFISLLAAFEALLHRLAGQSDFAVAFPVAGRDRHETEPLLGFFVNTLLARARLDAGVSYRDLVRRTRAEVLDAYAHQDVPFEKVVEALQTERDPARSPLAQALFAMHDAHARALDLPNLDASPFGFENPTSKFDLMLVMADVADGFRATLEYDADLFDQATVRTFAQRFQALLAGMLRAPDAPIEAVDVLAEDERAALLGAWRGEARPYPRDASVAALFREQAARSPDAAALRFAGRTTTYRELDQASDRVAGWLVAHGVEPGDFVGVLAERGPDLVAALLGALKAGAAFVPLDPAHPPERTRFILHDTRPSLVLAEAGGDAHGVPALALSDLLAREPPAAPPAALRGGDAPAYVMYTSGSTGQPKGVVVPHRGIVRLVHGQDHVTAAPGDVFLLHAPVTFDASTFEIWTPLLHGATLAIAPPGHLSLAELGQVLREHGVTTLWLTAPLFHLMVEEDVDALRGVRQLFSGGDALSPRHVAKALAALPGCRIVNGYGPTENTTFTTVHELRPGDAARPSIPIGRPVANTTAYVLDDARRLVPVGVRGELYVGGDGLALGYLGRDDLTAERFVTWNGERLYRTGDVVRWLPDGTLEFHGRTDHQVKVRGFRIELGEVEAALHADTDVRLAAVVAHAGPTGEKSLVAYACPKPGRALDGERLRARIAERLPEHMVPSLVVVMDDLPLNANGKVDRRALPEPETVAQRGPAEPRTETERWLAGLWSDLLGVPTAGPQDSFFDLGGHSLLATRLASRIRQATGVELPLRAVFQHPTLEALAREVDAARPSAAAPPAAIPRHEGPARLSYAQQRLWFLQQWEPESHAYNVADALRLEGPLDAGALDAALRDLVERHHVLRTTYRTDGGDATQVVGPVPARVLDVVDLAREDDPHARARAIADAEARAPFDLAKGPMLRARLLRLAAEEHVLLLTLHHVATDGWSQGILLRELGQAYEARRAGRAPTLAPLAVQYADFAEWQRGRLEGDGMQALLAHWTRALADLPPLDLPTDRPRPTVQSHDGAFLRFRLPKDVLDGLDRLSKEEGTSLFMPLLAAYQALLHRYSGQEDFGVGTPIAGRTVRDVEDLVGFFVNTLVLRADLKGEPTFREVVRRARDACLAAYAHQELPFEKLVDALQPARDLSRAPLAQANLVFQNTPEDGGFRLGDLRVSRLERGGIAAKQDLTFVLREAPDGLDGAVTYATALFDEATVRRMAGHFARLLAAAVAEPDTPIARLPLLTDAEAREMLEAWNRTATPEPHARLVHETIADHARTTPDAVAVACGEDALTFAELDRRANRLARRLQALGVGPDHCVALCGERSIDLLVGMLGTLKAGGAYVPLDLGTPRERARYVLEECGARVGLAVGASAESLLDACLVLRLDDPDLHETDEADAAAPPCAATPDSLAYVIYTSGSTGKPKGVMVRHGGLANYVGWCVSTPLLEGGNGTLVHSSLAFDLALTGLYPALAAGKRVRLVAEDGPTALADALRKEKDLSFVKLTPSHLKLLSHELAPQEMAGRVRAFVTGGEQLTPEHLHAWLQADPALRVLNHYGPTETVIGCCTTWVQPADLDRGTIPIGRPIHNTRVYVLDARMQPVPVGVPGELYVGGAGVARGYLNRPDLTAERFVTWNGERVYRTGDLVRWRGDGRVEFLGRLDHQVKIRGYRVELGEVESVLREHADVRDAVVVAREDGGHKRLVAYVAAPAADAEAIRRFVGERLPEYMVPAVVVALEKLPLNANGKVDRKALPEPGQARRDAGAAGFVAPRNEVEEVIARTWAEVLRLDRVGVEDNYFDLGGDSIMSIQIIVRCAQRGVRFTPKQLFQHQTVAELAKVAGSAVNVEAEQGIVTGEVPLTPIFQHFFARDLDEPHHFNMSFLMEAPADANASALRDALRGLLAHHDALRLTFRRDADAWRADVQGMAEDVPFEEHDYGALSPEAQAEAFMRDSHRLQATFDLAKGPLARMALYRFGEARTPRLLFAVHHLVVDAVSWRILFEDLETAYAQARRGEPVRLPPKTTSFRRWAQRLQEHASSPETLAELDYWTNEQSPTEARLPLDHPHGRNTLASGGRVDIVLTEEETRQLLHEVPRAYRTQINDVLLTALLQTYHQWTGHPTLTVELEGHGREEVVGGVDLSRTVGWFTVLFPSKLHLTAPDDPGRSLREVRDKLRAIPNRGLGYGLLRHMATPDVRARLAAMPRPDVRFNYLGVFDPDARAAGTFKVNADSRAADQSRRGMRTQLLDLTGSVSRGRLRLAMTYSEELHRRETIEKLAEAYGQALRALIRHCVDLTSAGPAPSDFPLANLEKRDLEKVLRKLVKR